jgi:PPOX class probable F420-dependent enzyme
MSREQRERFLQGLHVAVLTTIADDGTPVPTPIWYAHRDGMFYFRTADTSARIANIRRDPRVSICIQEERPPYKAVIAYGTATIEPELKWLADWMPRRYLGYIGAIAYNRVSQDNVERGEEVTIVVRPNRMTSFDYTPETPLVGRAWLIIKRVLPSWL